MNPNQLFTVQDFINKYSAYTVEEVSKELFEMVIEVNKEKPVYPPSTLGITEYYD